MDKLKSFLKNSIQKLKDFTKKITGKIKTSFKDKKAIPIAATVIVFAVVLTGIFIAVRRTEPSDILTGESGQTDTAPADGVESGGEDSETEKDSEKDDKDKDDSEEGDESEKDSEKESETEKKDETTAKETTSAPTADTTAPQGSTTQSGSIDVEVGVSGGSSSNGGTSSGGSSGNTSSPQVSTDPSRPHVYADAPIGEYEDTSTTLPYMPLRKEGATKPGESYNRPLIRSEDMKPGVLLRGSTTYSTTLIGYDGFLFCGDTFEDYEGTSHYSSTDSLVKKWSERSDWLKSLGKRLYIVIVPNKNSIYSNYMPESYPMGSYRRIDQVVDALSSAGVNVIDTRESLLAAKAAYPQRALYYKTDTHWNNHGGFIAYQQIMNVIKKDFPNVVVHTGSDYQINYCETFMKDQAYYLGTYDATSEPGPVYTLKSGKTASGFTSRPKDPWGQWAFCYKWPCGYSDHLYWYKWTNNYNSSAPSMYMLRDSFSVALSGFLKDSFKQSTFDWTYKFDKNTIQNSGADVIILQIAEKHIKTALAS